MRERQSQCDRQPERARARFLPASQSFRDGDQALEQALSRLDLETEMVELGSHFAERASLE
jgi:hypothetical protein